MWPSYTSYVIGSGKNEKHEYYQWISLTLLVQSVCFFLPAWLWSYWEKGYIQDVVGGNGIKVLDDILSKGEDHCKKISKEIGKKVVDNMGSHRLWAAKFIFCEILNFSTTVSQIFFTDYFLNGNFIKYGLNMIEYVVNDHIDDRENPMEKVTHIRHIRHIYILLYIFWFLFRPSPLGLIVCSIPTARVVLLRHIISDVSSQPISSTRSCICSSVTGGSCSLSWELSS